MSPRDGSGVYHTLAGTDAITDQTIDSGRYNSNVHDIETDLNTPRPIIAGGTGAGTAVDARHNIGAEVSNAQVVNYSTQVWESGSFWSSGSVGIAGGAPADGHAYGGIAIVANNDQNYVALEVADLNTGARFTRQKSTTWGPWTVSDGSDKVAKIGDTMTGDLTVYKAWPTLWLNKTVVATGCQIVGQNNGFSRWTVRVGDQTPDTGANLGSDFSITRHADDGSFLSQALTIARDSGRIYMHSGLMAAANEVANKAYVDSVAGIKVAKAGDVMTGDLNISKANPSLYLTKAGSGQASSVFGVQGVNPRWSMALGDATAESGANAGSNFLISRYADGGGAAIDSPLTIERSTGKVTVGSLQSNTSITSTGGIVSGAGVQAVNGTYYFVDGTHSVQYSGGNFTFAGGNLVVNGTINSTGTITAASGVFQAKAPAGASAYFVAQDETGTPKGYFYWDRGSDTERVYHPAGPFIALHSDGSVDLASGFNSRAGISGAYSAHVHNFEWVPGTGVKMWVDNVAQGIIQITCDHRIKKDITPLPSMWNKVKALKPISYTPAEYGELWPASDEVRWGLVAHEVQEALIPSAANGTKDGEELQSPNLLAVIAALTKTLQEAMVRIEALEARP